MTASSCDIKCDIKYDGPPKFVHLHTHTVYSTLDGVATPEQLFAACKEREWPALAITEHGHMASVPDNYFAAKENGIKYIAACEIYFNDWEPKRRELSEQNIGINEIKAENNGLYERIRRNRHLTVLAMNNVGVTNLIKLTTQAYTTGFYYRPRIWLDKLLEYSEGLIVLSGCLNGPVSHEIRKGKNLRNGEGYGALDYVEKFAAALGDRYFIELQMPCLPASDADCDDAEVFAALNAIAKKYKRKPVLTCDGHYLDRRDFQIQKVMMAIDQGLTVDSPDLFHVNSDEQFFKTREELWNTFKTRRYSKYVTDQEFHEMCDNTLLVAEMCDNYKPDRSPKVPALDDAKDTLVKCVMDELKRRGLLDDTRKFVVDNRQVTYREQATIELKRFCEKNFQSYFLITQDLIQFSLKNGWPVGPRGSVGGSLVCFLLGITSLDPLMWGLSFDRFLSPSRGGYMLNIKAE